MTALRNRIEAALDEHDATLSRCPVNNPKRGHVFGAHDRCPRCRATASGSCGLSSGAGYHLAKAVRAALKADAQ